ncbi:MAG: leucine-rich repeat domain-containing protein, partial [Muribaculaceae bacterium]
MKVKSLLKHSMLLAALLAGTSAYAATFTVDGINYEPITETTCKVIETLYELENKDIVIPETVTDGDFTYTVTEIGAKAFYSYNTVNNDITSVKLPETITKIGDSAFDNNMNIKEFTIPAACTEIGAQAFFNTRITNMTVLGPVKSIGASAFASTVFKSIVFPEGLETVGDFVFGNQKSLVEIEFPSTVKSFGYYAFSNCSSVEKFVCKAVTPPSVGIVLFTKGTTATLYVPKGSKEAYAAATGWSSFPTIEEIEPTGVEAVDAEGVKVVANGGV